MLKITVTQGERMTFIRVAGRIDSTNAHHFGAALGREVDQNHIHMTLDLGEVNFLSSAGLREIVDLLKQLRRASGDLCIRRAPQHVRSVLEMSGLDALFHLFDCEEEEDLGPSGDAAALPDTGI